MRRTFIAVMAAQLGFALAVPVLPADAQQASDPNLKMFYMARRQVQITDDQSPIINDMRTGPQAGQPLSPQQNGALTPYRPLPKAGYQSYSSTIPSVRRSLPQTNRGLPKKMPSKRGKAGTLKRTAKKTAPKPVGTKSYSSYKGYGGPSSARKTPSSYSSTYGGSTGRSTSTQVKGSVLHWSRKNHRGH